MPPIMVGKLIAQRAKEKELAMLSLIEVDIYHGRVKSLADAAREEGLNFRKGGNEFVICKKQREMNQN